MSTSQQNEYFVDTTGWMFGKRKIEQPPTSETRQPTSDISGPDTRTFTDTQVEEMQRLHRVLLASKDKEICQLMDKETKLEQEIKVLRLKQHYLLETLSKSPSHLNLTAEIEREIAKDLNFLNNCFADDGFRRQNGEYYTQKLNALKDALNAANIEDNYRAIYNTISRIEGKSYSYLYKSRS